MMLFPFEFFTSMLKQLPLLLLVMPLLFRILVLLFNLQQLFTGLIVSLYVLLDFVFEFGNLVIVFATFGFVFDFPVSKMALAFSQF